MLVGEGGGNIEPRPILPNLGKFKVVAGEDAFQVSNELCQDMAPLVEVSLIDLGQLLFELFSRIGFWIGCIMRMTLAKPSA